MRIFSIFWYFNWWVCFSLTKFDSFECVLFEMCYHLIGWRGAGDTKHKNLFFSNYEKKKSHQRFQIAWIYSIIASQYTQYVTYGSVLKLLNTDYNVRLHSHDVKYGTGSGQQSITGTEQKEDVNSHWSILNVTNAAYQRG